MPNPPVDFAAWQDEMSDHMALDPLRLPDGTVVAVPHPTFWPEPLADESANDWAVRIFGADEWAAFTAAGGNWAQLRLYVQSQTAARGDKADLGESSASPESSGPTSER